jgi:alkylated DNA repair dioxygenase AlkB
MQQLDLIDDSFCISQDHLSIKLQTGFLSEIQANELLAQLIATTSWQQPKLKVYGKWHHTPRLVRFIGDPNLDYKYSNTQHDTQPWTSTLISLKQRVEVFSGETYNCVLLNYYRDGQDTMGWHADDEAELGLQATIVSLSIGAARDIHFKPKTGGELIKLTLPCGSLLLMKGQTQQYWLHHIPKRARCDTPRINLTFRKILTSR